MQKDFNNENNLSEEENQISDDQEGFDIIPSNFGFRIDFAQMEELQKNSLEINSVSNPTFSKQFGEKDDISNRPKASLFKFWRILQNKIWQIRENRKKFRLFQKVYKEKILNSDFKNQKTPSKYVIDPKNSIYLAVEFLKFLSMIFLMLLITYLWSFEDVNIVKENRIDIYVSLILLLDISFQFNIAIILRGQIVHDRITICKQYVSKQLFQDAIFLLSFLLIINTENIGFVIIFYASGVSILIKTIKKFEDLFDLSLTNTEILKLIKLLFLINLLAHFIACIWYFVGNNTQYLENNWLDQKGVRNQPKLVLYVYSFYWSVVTMVTVGYGDITPQNYLEMIVCVFIMFLSCGVYAYSLNLIGQIVSTLNHQSDKLEENIRTLNKYFKQHNIKEDLQSRIKNYIEFKIKEEETQSENIYLILNKLSSHLKNKIISHIYQRLVQNCPILNENFSKNTIASSSKLITTHNYEPEDFIIDQNLRNQNSFYFIDSGVIQLYEKRSKTVVLELKNGQFFGEYEFFTNSQAQFSIKCKTQCKILQLSRQSFIEILNKDEIEIFHAIKHSFEFKIPQKQWQCLACNQNDHIINNCNVLFYNPDIKNDFLKDENHKQRRKPFKRQGQKFNSYTNMQLNQEKQFEYLQFYRQELTNQEEFEDEYVIVSNDSRISSLLNNGFKTSELQEIQGVKENNQKKHATIIKTKQSIPEQYPSEKQALSSCKKFRSTQNNLLHIQNEQAIDIDRMKEFNKYFEENNYEVQIKRYNQNYFNHSAFTQRRKTTKAMKFIQI